MLGKFVAQHRGPPYEYARIPEELPAGHEHSGYLHVRLLGEGLDPQRFAPAVGIPASGRLYVAVVRIGTGRHHSHRDQGVVGAHKGHRAEYVRPEGGAVLYYIV